MISPLIATFTQTYEVVNVFHLFENSCNRFPNRTALVVEKKVYSYSQLQSEAAKIAQTLSNFPEIQNIGIYARRSFTAFSGILGTLQQGKTYVPLNAKFPIERNKIIIDIADISIFIIDKNSFSHFEKLSETLSRDVVLLFPEHIKEEIPKVLYDFKYVFTRQDFIQEKKTVTAVDGETNTYILFTSGSTGIPKGVPISQKSCIDFIDYLSKRYEIDENDKFSQCAELTFDPSFQDMFVCWSVGASLYNVPDKLLLGPAKFIKENSLTFWFSVPFIAQFMDKFRMLKPDSFPALRYSCFSGEPLMTSLVKKWQIAAPNSIIENIYGPTETMACTHYFVPKNKNEIKQMNGIISIGDVYTTQSHCLVDKNNQLTHGQGELCISGSQVMHGYYKNEEKTQKSLIEISGKHGKWYKTGDWVKEETGNFFYQNRIDFQVKIRGNRVELDEINSLIRNFTHAAFAISIPYPVKNGIANCIYSFVDDSCEKKTHDIKTYLSTKLQDFMIPKEILYLKEIPLNSNGKLDRKALIKILESKEYEKNK